MSDTETPRNNEEHTDKQANVISPSHGNASAKPDDYEADGKAENVNNESDNIVYKIIVDFVD